jgi:hypothetical protein
MKAPLTRLIEKTSGLGNYNRKYMHIISTNIDKLTEALEQQDMLERVHLWTYSLEIPSEMDTVMEAASNQQETLDFLSCFYALQFMHMNLRMVDTVKLDLETSPQPAQTGKKLMLEAGRMFRSLTKAYMQRLLDIFLGECNAPEYVMMGVGTRSDQDDIDLGIIHRGPEDPGDLNHAIGRLASQMFKTATRLHFHLSEHVGGTSLTTTIEEYEKILEGASYDFVIVTEMLGAAPILGSSDLYDDFRKRVTDRFYFSEKNRHNRYHEGYLRSILGEIHSLLKHPKPPESINPKEDALRPIKGILSALKLVHGVTKNNAWNIIDELKEKDPKRQKQYESLEISLSFFELFRHLYQILVAQDEDIVLYESSVENMVAKIAEMLGFEKKGVVSAENFLLVFYYDSLEKSIRAIDILMGDLKKHLRRVSIYTPIFSGEIHKKPGYEGNLAVDFVRASSFSEGITYWDDFLEELDAGNNIFYSEFMDSFQELPERIRRKVARGYVSGTRYDAASALRFLVTIGRKIRDEDDRSVFDLISRLYINELEVLPSASASLTHMSYSYPGALNSFLALLDWEQLVDLRRMAQRKPALPELLPLHDQLITLIDVHYQSSHFFKRHFHPILAKYPIFTKSIHSNERLKEIADGFYGDLTATQPLEERIERLGDYYDMEFVRIALRAMAGAGSELTDAEFVEFCDNYTLSLYEYCLMDVHLSMGYALHFQDRFALYAAGGLAREQGFDDDYDMIVILDSTDQQEIDYCNNIVAKMNSHILKRGILPHHRFAAHFSSYVASLDQLAELLGSGYESAFVEQSQILGSRMLVGSSKLEEKLLQKIINPFIFDKWREYVGAMKSEMEMRHAAEDEALRSNMKECHGGLRDVEMLLLIYKAKFKVRDPLTRKFLGSLQHLDPAHAEEFRYIEDHLTFLKNLRDLFRLKVAASDAIDPEYLLPVVSIMGYGDGQEAAEKLYKDFLKRTDRAAEIITGLAGGILS